jgi:hypothetical protein
MRKLVFALLLLFLFPASAQSDTQELDMHLPNGTLLKIWRNGVYTHYVQASAHGTKNACCAPDSSYSVSTFWLDIGDSNSNSPYGPPLESGEKEYTIIVDGRAAVLTTGSTGPLGDISIIFRNDSLILWVCLFKTPSAFRMANAR